LTELDFRLTHSVNSTDLVDNVSDRRKIMKTSIQTTFNPLAGVFWCVVALVIVMVTPVANAEGPFEISMHDVEVYGTRDLESGNYERAIERLERALARTGTASSRRAPLLTNLCVAYTMTRNLEAAEKYCDEAVDTHRDLGLAYNNRGVASIARGDYVSACADFAAALDERGGGGSVKRNNLHRCVDRLSSMNRQATVTAP
jgi:tetratricopeptide (TPR) repeat protein